MNKSLQLIINEANQLEEMLIHSGGELTPEIEAALAVRDLNLVEKIDGYAHIMDRFASLEAHYKQKAEFFAKISKQCAAVQARLEGNIKFAMQEFESAELLGTDIKFTLKPTAGSLVVEDEAMVPVEFKTEIISTVLDKKRLKDACSKNEIPGARIEPGFSLRCVANTPKSKKAVSNA